ncbi:hypothetical protein AEAE_0601 [Aeriscardovia aeriphila]|uniref:Uncharacterized protein n=2 Tax=Aeriscardovia aeriphila TaxID=218139 RepID=A0A261FAW6_9BIFI|nr:hypothetical protein AEAE_0601 [Aeriscardovia aeriphila]
MGHMMRKSAATAITLALLTSLTACSSQPSSNTGVPAHSRVGLLLPADPSALQSSMSLNSWASLAKRTQQALQKSGFSSSSITTQYARDAVQQAQQLEKLEQQWSSEASENSASSTDLKGNTLFLCAPRVEPVTSLWGGLTSPSVSLNSSGFHSTPETSEGDTPQYVSSSSSDYQSENSESDKYTSSSQHWNTSRSSSRLNSSSSSSNSAGSSESSDSAHSEGLNDSAADDTALEDDEELDAARSRSAELVRTLSARGVRMVGCSDLVSAHMDAYVDMATPESIGVLQAREALSKIRANTLSASNPAQVLLLVPGNPQNEASKDFLSGVFSMLETPLQQGVIQLVGLPEVKSLSSFLDSSAARDFYFGSDLYSADISHRLTSLLDDLIEQQGGATTSNGLMKALPFMKSSTIALDAVIAGTDYISTQLVSVLTSKGYQGSAADINPDVSLSGIVNSLSGKKVLNKHKVPYPANTLPSAEFNSMWPVISGYGAIDVPSIVSGKEWVTGISNEESIASLFALLARNAALHKKLAAKVNELEGMTLSSRASRTLISVDLVPISSSQVKNLIKEGYISAADAGL